MKKAFSLLVIVLFFFCSLRAQDKPVHPSFIGFGVYHGLSQPLRDLPALTPDEWEKMELDAMKPRNEDLERSESRFTEASLPEKNDPVWQKEMGSTPPPRAPIFSWDGQNSPYYPPDDNGVAGPNHFMQTVNTVYAIYSKTGTLLAGPTNLNLLFGNVTGANCNDGDPVILYDDQADRWLVVEFSICGANDYILMAVSQSNDPTGSWHRYSFDVDDMPDYEKIGIWQDGYYMATNNGNAKDIYVMERSKMLSGQTAQVVGFDNPWRPTFIVPPVDNDGAFAPAGSPGLFITYYDDYSGAGSDQLWIYELAVNWTNLSSSTFNRVQQLNVPPFNTSFTAKIKQQGTTMELDPIANVIMNAPQYRNFGSHQTLVCCHTVDVDNTDHAGIRWYELRRTTGSWTLRQSGTYAPDGHSRWMGSIRLNGQNEIGLGYSISSSTLYPGIRYTGQSATTYTLANGILDLSEQTVITGSYPQTSYNRWGDYASISIDPTNDKTFWFTTEYIGTSEARKTEIFSFEVGEAQPQPDLVVQIPAVTPSSVEAGQALNASCTVLNQGATVAGASNLKYYLSSDNTYGTGDTYLAADAIPSLAANASSQAVESLTIPAGTIPGTYFILFVADAINQVFEVDENNNTGSIQFTVTSAAGPPDLLVLNPAASPTIIEPGLTTTASCSVKNVGTGASAASSLKYYLSSENAYGSNATYLATNAVPVLPAGSSVALNKALTIPANTGAGNWYILFIADADAQVMESNETNNTGFVLITVSAPLVCNSTTQYPSNTLNPNNNWKYQKSIYAGEYTAFNVSSNTTYEFSYCSSDGASASYNSELTLRNKATEAFLAYSDDACGDDAKITWTATFTGIVKVITTVSGCGTNSISSKLGYRQVAKKAEPIGGEFPYDDVIAYPNPTQGKISLEATSGFEGYQEIVIYDIAGRAVNRINLPPKPQNIYTIDLGDRPAGYYLVRITGHECMKQFKILVAR